MIEMPKQVYETPDGLRFESKQEAIDHLRKPKIMEALNLITSGNAHLSELLLDNQDHLDNIFSTGTIQRVTKSERKQLEKALEAVKANGDKAFNFIIENAGAIAESFRWPAVKRVSDEEKTATIKRSLMATFENNEALVDWVIEKKDAIFAAYDAGKIKREVSPKATEALEAYRQKKAAEKAEKAAAEGVDNNIIMEQPEEPVVA